MEITRRNFIKLASIIGLSGVINGIAGCIDNPANVNADGLPPNDEAIVYFSKNIDAEHLIKLYNKINSDITGKVGIKINTGEPNSPNIISRDLVKALQAQIPNSAIVETNTLYEGERFTTERHRQTLQVNGWTFCPIDILDEDGDIYFTAKNGLRLKKIYMGSHLEDYDSLVVLTHFTGHTMAGYSGSLKNIATGCASKHGKQQIYGEDYAPGSSFLERLADSGKAICDHFGKKIIFINVLQRLSVDCDCIGMGAAAPDLPDLGMLASTDILAVEKAALDLIYNFDGEEKDSFIERIQSRAGLYQLDAMKRLNM